MSAVLIIGEQSIARGPCGDLVMREASLCVCAVHVTICRHLSCTLHRSLSRLNLDLNSTCIITLCIFTHMVYSMNKWFRAYVSCGIRYVYIYHMQKLQLNKYMCTHKRADRDSRRAGLLSSQAEEFNERDLH